MADARRRYCDERGLSAAADLDDPDDACGAALPACVAGAGGCLVFGAPAWPPEARPVGAADDGDGGAPGDCALS